MKYQEAVQQISAILDQLSEADQYRVAVNLARAAGEASLHTEHTEHAKRKEAWREENKELYRRKAM